jgi:ABC-2 type transport system ATP-binding protein
MSSTHPPLAIDVRGLSMTYPNGTKAVRSIDLDVRVGEVFALLGPNGAGKTTTVEILEGFRRRTDGSASVLGIDPSSPTRVWRDRVGVVFQSSGTSDEVTVAELLALQASYHASPRPVDETIALVGLEEKRNIRVDRLSGGQQRRLDVARGIIGQPDLLFLDEPTTGFDPEARRQFWDLIRSLRADGTTIVLTTHYMDEAEVLADRIAVIVDGNIVATGTPANLGGRDDARSIVRWTENGVAHEQPSDRPAEVVTTLVGRIGTDIADLTISRPSLESTYLDLVHRHSAESGPRDVIAGRNRPGEQRSGAAQKTQSTGNRS